MAKIDISDDIVRMFNNPFLINAVPVRPYKLDIKGGTVTNETGRKVDDVDIHLKYKNTVKDQIYWQLFDLNIKDLILFDITDFKVFIYILNSLEVFTDYKGTYCTDWFTFNFTEFSELLNYRNKTNVYESLNKLKDLSYISKRSKSTYWINPYRIWKGNLINFMKNKEICNTIVIEDKADRHRLYKEYAGTKIQDELIVNKD